MHIKKRVLRRVLIPPEAMRQRLRAFKTLTDGERGNMCGRFGLFAELDSLAEQFNFDPSIMRDIYSPRWNIPPTVPVLTVQPPSSGGQPSKNSRQAIALGYDRSAQPTHKGKRTAAVQRPRRDCASPAVIQAAVQGAPLPGSGQRIL